MAFLIAIVLGATAASAQSAAFDVTVDRDGHAYVGTTAVSDAELQSRAREYAIAAAPGGAP
jgi:hypothetical protein